MKQAMTRHEHDILRGVPARGSGARAALAAVAVPVVVFICYTALRAVSESWNNDGFPEALAVKLELLPVLFPVHMVTGGLALLLVPLMLALRGTRWHRPLGWVTGADVLAAGVTAIPVAFTVPVTLVSAAGFITQAIVWMGLFGLGVWHIRNGRVAAHQRAMLMMAAVTSGAMFFRIYLALWAGFGWHEGFRVFYACDAWLAWGLPLLAVALLTRHPRQAAAAPR